MRDINQFRDQIKKEIGVDYSEEELYKRFGKQMFNQSAPAQTQPTQAQDPAFRTTATDDQFNSFASKYPDRDPEILREGFNEVRERLKNKTHGWRNKPIKIDELESLGRERIKANAPGLFKEAGMSFARGVNYGLPQMVGKGLQWIDPDGGSEVVENIGKSIEQFGDRQKTKLEPIIGMSKEAELSPWYSGRHMLATGPENMVTSLVPMAAGLGVGAVGGTIAGATTGLATLGTLFYGGSAEEKYRQSIEAGLSEEDAKTLANIEGGVEAGGEIIADLIPLHLFGGLGKAAKNGIIKSLTGKKPAKEILKDIGKTILAEEATEIGQAAAQTYASNEMGVDAGSIPDSIKEVVGPTLFMSLVFGGAGTAYNSQHRKAITQVLSDPQSDPKDAIAALNEVTGAIKEIDPGLAKQFLNKAVQLRAEGKPIVLNDDSFYTGETETAVEEELPPEVKNRAIAEQATMEALSRQPEPVQVPQDAEIPVDAYDDADIAVDSYGPNDLTDTIIDPAAEEAREKIQHLQNRYNEIKSKKLPAAQKKKRLEAVTRKLEALGAPIDKVGMAQLDRQKEINKTGSQNDGFKPNPQSLIPEDLSEALYLMRDEYANSQTRGTGRDEQGNVIGFAAGTPDYMRKLNEDLKDKPFGRQEVATLISNAENGKLTEGQSKRFDILMDAAKDLKKNHPTLTASEDQEFIEKKGYEFTGEQNKVVADLEPGDKFYGTLDGVEDEYEHKGFDEKGDAIIQDGITKHVDPLDQIKIEGIKLKNKPFSKAKSEEDHKRRQLETVGLDEDMKKEEEATQAALLAGEETRKLSKEGTQLKKWLADKVEAAKQDAKEAEEAGLTEDEVKPFWETHNKYKARLNDINFKTGKFTVADLEDWHNQENPDSPVASMEAQIGRAKREMEKGKAAKVEQKKKTVHDFSSTQINLPKDSSEKIKSFSKKIPESELYTEPNDDGYGREEEPHVTVRYGLDTVNPADVAPAFKNIGPIKAKMGKVSIFESDKYDVVKVDIESEDLKAANKAVGDTVDVPGETFKDYMPHATIAYVKKGEGKKYVGDKSFEGQEIEIDHVVLSGKDGKMHKIPLTGKPTPQQTVGAESGKAEGEKAGKQERLTLNEKMDAVRKKYGSRPSQFIYKPEDLEAFTTEELNELADEGLVERADISKRTMAEDFNKSESETLKKLTGKTAAERKDHAKEIKAKRAKAKADAIKERMPVLLNDAGDMGAMIHPSTKKPGKYQVTSWDKRGFSGDTWYDSKEEAIQGAIEDGYRNLDTDGVFKKLSKSKEFLEGVAATQAAQAKYKKQLLEAKAKREAEEATKARKDAREKRREEKGLDKTTQADVKSGKESVNETSQNYTLQEPEKAIDFKLKKPKQLELSFGKKKDDSVSKTVPATRRRVVMRRTGEISSSGTVVQTPADAAGLVSHIGKLPQEHAFAITTDKDGTVLEVHSYSKGTSGSASIKPEEIAGPSLDHKTAKTVYFVHNHPGGALEASPADLKIFKALTAQGMLQDIDTQNIIIAGDKYGVHKGESGTIPNKVKKKTLPVKERRYADDKAAETPASRQLSNSTDAANWLAQEHGNAPGILFLNAQNQEVGFVPVNAGVDQSKKVMAKIIRGVNKYNASAIVLNFPDTGLNTGTKREFAEILSNVTSVRILDVLTKDGSYTDRLGMPSDGLSPTYNIAGKREIGRLDDMGPLYSRTTADLSKVTLSDIRKAFPTREAGIDRNGNVWVRIGEGKTITVKKVAQIDDNTLSMEWGYKGLTSADENVFGAYHKNTILLSAIADQWTIRHESYHSLEDLGVVTPVNIRTIEKAIKKSDDFRKVDWNDKTDVSEARAEFVTQALKNREAYRKTVAGKIIQKIQDFIDGIVNLFHATGAKIVRDIESGKIYDRQVNGESVKTTMPAYEQAAQKWYSATVKAVENFDFKTMKGEDLYNWIKKQPGVKQAELDWMGIEDWLKEQDKVSKEDVVSWLFRNGVTVEEVVKGELDFVTKKDVTGVRFKDFGSGSYVVQFKDDIGDIEISTVEARDEDEAIQAAIDRANYDGPGKALTATKFSNYQEPGGTSYKELLITLPEFTLSGKEMRELYRLNSLDMDEFAEGEFEKWKSLERKLREGGGGVANQFQSSHFEEPNILAHVRFNERTGPNGEKVLFIEEVQSDWAQKGRKEGFVRHNKIEVGFQFKSGDKITKIKGDKIFVVDELGENGGWYDRETVENWKDGNTPNMPYKTTPQWTELALKRMVRYAAENGFDSVAWTPGEVQAARYDLSKQVDRITARTFKKRDYVALWIYDKNDSHQNLETSKEKLEDYVGKELAEKILAQPTGRNVDYSGLDLKVGGEGMKSFYDRILPSVANKFFGKKAWGKAKVGEVEIEYHPSEKIESGDIHGTWVETPSSTTPIKKLTAHSLPITPEMKSKALREGMPMFQAQAWHGSPHTFDKFDISKIGSGEGAQAFGYGLYFTEKEDVARGYAQMGLYKDVLHLDGKPMGQKEMRAASAIREIMKRGFTRKHLIIKQLENRLESYNEPLKTKLKPVIDQAVQMLNDAKTVELKDVKNRNVYNVTLHKGKDPSEYTYMEWYKKLSPQVVDAYAGSLEAKGYGDMAQVFRKNARFMDGRELYRELSDLYGSDKEASAVLLRAGIDGIKYPAGSLSDSNTGDVSNYVVFDDRAVTIEDHVLFQKEKAKAAKNLQDDSLSILEKIKSINKPLTRRGKKDLSYFGDLLLSIPSFFADKIPAVKDMFNATQERQDRYHETLQVMEVDRRTGYEVVKVLTELEKADPGKYNQVKKYLLSRDRKNDGYRIIEDPQTKLWDIYNRQNKVVDSLPTEQMALDEAVKLEGLDMQAKGFNPEQVNAVVQVRIATNKGFDLLIEEMRKLEALAEAEGKDSPFITVKEGDKEVELTIREAIARMGDMRGSYFPRIRNRGKFVLTAYKDGADNILTTHNNRQLMNIERAKLEKDGYKVETSKSNQLGEDVFDMAGELVKTQQLVNAAMRRMEAAQGQNEKKFIEDTLKETQSIFHSALTEQIANVIRERGSRAHMEKRSANYYEGFETDPKIAVAKYMRSLAGGYAKREMVVKMLQAFTGTQVAWHEFKDVVSFEGEFKDFVTGNPKIDEAFFNKYNKGEKAEWTDYQSLVREQMIDQTQQQNAFKWGKAYISEVTRNREFADEVIGTIKGLAVAKYLAFRVFAAPLVNLTALGTSVPASMKGAGIPLRKSGKYLITAMKRLKDYKFNPDKLSAEDKWVFDQIKEYGWDNPQFNSEALNVLRGNIGKGWDKALQVGMYTFGESERLNRISTIAGAYFGLKDLASSKGKSKEELLEQAKQVSDDSHGIYNKGNHPFLAMGANPAAQIARMFYVFRTFSHTYLLNMKKLGFEQQDYAALTYMLVSPALIAGAGASAITPLVAMILSAFGMDDPEEETYRKIGKAFGPGAESTARFGLAGAGGKGISIKGSLAIGIGDLPTSVKDILGAPGSVISDAFIDGVPSLVKGDFSKGMEKILPTGMGNLFRAVRESTEGLSTRSNAPLFYGNEQVKLSTAEAFYRGFSFNPARIAEVREKQWKDRKLEMKYSDWRKEIYARFKKLYLSGNVRREDLAELMGMVEGYNEKARAKGLPVVTRRSIRTNIKRNFRPSKRERGREARMSN